MIWPRSILFNLFFYLWTALLMILWLPSLALPVAASRAGARMSVGGVDAALRLLCGIEVEIRGRLPAAGEAVLIAAKHQSAWDTVKLLTLCGHPAIVLKAELMKIPLYGWYARHWGMIPVDRKAGAQALRGMIAAARGIARAGRPIVIFPQGTRAAPGRPHPYQPGVAGLYAATKLPCVPVALNSGCFWPRRSLLRRPGTIIVEFLETIPAGLPRDVFMARLEAAVEAASDALIPAGFPKE